VTPADSAHAENASCEERAENRNGASRVYVLRVDAAVVGQEVEEQLARMGKSVRLPGFRPGKIPVAVLQQRYGAQTRADVINRISAETTQRMLPKGSVVASVVLLSGGESAGADSGDLEFQATVTHLPDLPAPDFSAFTIELLNASGEDLKSAGLNDADAQALFRHHLKLQVLDHLDAAYPFPLLPFLVEREFATIWKAAEVQSELPIDQAEREMLRIEFRAIAERRLRLGLVIAEMGRRIEIRAAGSAELEDKVVDFLVTQAKVRDRQAGVEELRELAGAE
jgi:FKBP-type peptidyl-prolyl cis-trans isomerase (trigger factor)